MASWPRNLPCPAWLAHLRHPPSLAWPGPCGSRGLYDGLWFRGLGLFAKGRHMCMQIHVHIHLHTDVTMLSCMHTCIHLHVSTYVFIYKPYHKSMSMYIWHTYMHTYIQHTYMHTYMHTYIQCTYIYTCICGCACARVCLFVCLFVQLLVRCSFVSVLAVRLFCLNRQLHIWEFPKIGGTLFCSPKSRDPIIWGTIFGFLICGNSHIHLSWVPAQAPCTSPSAAKLQRVGLGSETVSPNTAL